MDKVTADEIERLFVEGMGHWPTDDPSQDIVDCPYADDTLERHWWTRGYAYRARLLRAIEAEHELKRMQLYTQKLEAVAKSAERVLMDTKPLEYNLVDLKQVSQDGSAGHHLEPQP